MAPLNIAIIGAGVGGPTAAIGLARNGHNVTLYDRTSSIGGVGYAFRITPNSDRCLKFLGIDVLASGAVEANWSRLMNYKGKLSNEFQENQNPEVDGLSVFAYRLGLQQQLLDEATNQGAQVRMGVEVTSVDVSSCTITFADSSTSSVDLIIASDGLHSFIRPYVVDSSVHFPKVSTGHSCIRAMIPYQAIQDDPVTSHMMSDKIRMVGFRAEDRLIGGYAVDYGRQFNLVCTHPEALSNRETSSGSDAEKSAYNQKIGISRCRKRHLQGIRQRCGQTT